ncbi:MAG: hypothetical protein DRP11_01350 [Candidatus Aenigmatarchaeota archaeon]|nr:MAG: hypothetical protein DRP11_01350 [Candidatus Aenigmarchaeota archaeon]
MAFKERPGLQDIINEIVKRTQENTWRIRAVEERTRVVETKLTSLEKMFLDLGENIEKNFDQISEDKKDLNTKTMKLENEIAKIRRILDKTVKKNELEEIENYIRLINPLNANFVTENDVRRLVKEMLGK